MNILVVGTKNTEKKIIDLCLKSKYLERIYTASSKPLEEIPNIEYSDLQDLSKKAKALHIDIVFVADKNLIQSGIVEICKKNFLNVISVNQKWYNLENNRLIAKQLINHYAINQPKIIKAPVSFPIVIKSQEPYMTKIAYSMQELIDLRESLKDKKNFLEEYLLGEEFYLLSLWDGKSAVHFDEQLILTEVQKDRLDLYQTKLNIMLSEEKADFIGFFVSKLLWAQNDWYVLEYIMHLNEKSDLDLIKSDFLYLLNLAIYQKLGEI